MLASPMAPWKGAPLRVVFTAEKPLDGELSLIAPNGHVAAASRDRHGGPPYFWFAEVAAPAPDRGRRCSCARRLRRLQTVTREIVVQRKAPPARAPARASGPAKHDLEPRDGKSVLRLDRDIVRRAARRSAVVEGDARSAARSVTQCPVQSSGPARGSEGARHSARLRRRALLPARLFRLQDGAAVRLREMHARRRRSGAEMPAVVEHRGRGAASGSAARAVDARSLASLRHVRAAACRTPPVFRLPRKPQGLVPGFGYYLRTTIANAVHSGNGRTAADDDDTDYYPVPLSEDTLRPGTIYADPYGHVLVLVKRVPQTGRRRRRVPRRRRAAGRDGRAEALLARQLPVRAGSGARQSRVQALPSDRAREERDLAAPDERSDREKSGATATIRSSSRSSRWRTSTTAWTT